MTTIFLGSTYITNSNTALCGIVPSIYLTSTNLAYSGPSVIAVSASGDFMVDTNSVGTFQIFIKVSCPSCSATFTPQDSSSFQIEVFDCNTVVSLSAISGTPFSYTQTSGASPTTFLTGSSYITNPHPSFCVLTSAIWTVSPDALYSGSELTSSANGDV